MPVHLCNVRPQSSAPSTSSLNFPPAHQSLLPASSPGVIPQTRPPFSDRPRLPLPESLQPPRASTHPGAASRSVSLSPASIPAAPASLFSAKLSARGKFRAILRSIDPPTQNSPCHTACPMRNVLVPFLRNTASSRASSHLAAKMSPETAVPQIRSPHPRAHTQ